MVVRRALLAPSCALALAVVAAGCGFGGPLTYGDDDTGEASASETSDATETETETGSEPETHPCGPTTGVVTAVLDGDTIELDSGARVRYLLIDTPEVGGEGSDCWGPQASEFNAMMVLGETVHLDYDAVCRDKYHRLLAYVTIDGRDDVEINRTLLEQGYACLLHIPPNGNDRVAEYQALEDAAKQAEVGMWGACATVACDF